MPGRDERGDRGDLERRAERREDLHSSLASPKEPDQPSRAHPDSAVQGDLPGDISAQSIASGRLILPLAAALAAIEHMARTGWRVDTWEGWVQLRDGGRARSLAHAGSFALPRDVERAAAVTKAGLERAQARWDRDPEYPGARLYFGLTFVAAT